MKKALDTQAIITALLPGVLLMIAALVAKLLDIGLAEAVFQIAALAAVIGGGTVAWNQVYSQRTMERISQEQRDEGVLQGANGEAQARDARERELAEMWVEREDDAGLQEIPESTEPPFDPLQF